MDLLRHEVLRGATPAVERAEARYLRALSAADRRTLATLLQRLLEAEAQPEAEDGQVVVEPGL